MGRYNFITCSNILEKDIEKIIRYRLSPLYFSLHAVSPEIRKTLLGDQNNRIFEVIDRLQKEDIGIEIQIVLCPGVNDGRELEKTIEYCRSKTNILSVGIVPVGITDFLPEKNRNFIRPFTVDEMSNVIQLVNDKYYDPGVYLADEFFLSTGVKLPCASYYKDFPQLENGIGQSRLLMDDMENCVFKCDVDYLVLTGTLVYPLMAEYLTENFQINRIENTLFGKNVTVSGLLSGKDIIDSLKNTPNLQKFEKIMLSSEMINEDGFFLDGISLACVEKEMGVKITHGYYFSDFFK